MPPAMPVQLVKSVMVTYQLTVAPPPGPLLGATPPGTASPRSNGIVPPDGGIREAPIVPGPTPASPWTNTLRREDTTREVSGVTCR